MKIKKWLTPEMQMSSIGRHSWSVARLFELSRGLPMMDIPIDHLNVWHKYESITLREMVMHMQAVNDSDLTKPIILDEDGEIMDGRHRIMKAMLLGVPTVKAVRFDENPIPCQVREV